MHIYIHIHMYIYIITYIAVTYIKADLTKMDINNNI